MRCAQLACAALTVVVPWLVLAGDPPAPPDAPAPAVASSDAQDLVFLGDSRPVYIRLHIQVDGKPLSVAWDEFITSLFKYLDVDGNGVLSQAELDRAPKPAFFTQLLRGNYSNPNIPKDRPAMEVSVALVGGKVTRDGLANYYRISGVEPFYGLIRDEAAQGEALTEVLFRELDANKDEKLSKEELLKAATVLHKLDLNDDEMISVEELLPPSQDMMADMPRMETEKTVILTDSSAFILLGPGDAASRVAFPLISKYDKDDDQKLSPAEINLDKSVFDQLDTDHDGLLSAKELAKFLKFQPVHAEVMIRLGTLAAGQDPVDFHQKQADAALRKLENGFLSMTFGDALVELGAQTGQAASYKSARQFLLDQFQAADSKLKRGFIDVKQADQTAGLRDLFQAADRNGDGKLTKEELTTYIDLLGKAVASSAVLTVSDHGRSLFSLLNPHHDGRLRQRELRSAWVRVAPWDKNQDGMIEREELPHQFDVYVSQGQPGGALPVGDRVAAGGIRADRRAATATKGPLWFLRMDRNGDGYVSLREFLGTKQEFQKIDTDGDGLISPEEADKADARLKQAGTKKP
jgi:Ca2+-binding EF-hand superfamily protein